MSNPGEENDTPIRQRAELIGILARGCKPREDWRIGTEHEKFGFRLPGHGGTAFMPPPFRPDGIEALLQAIGRDEAAWSPIMDDAIEPAGALIGLKGQGPEKGSSISLEPAGQFELSGGPLRTLHETRDEMAAHFESVRGPAEALGYGFAPIGFQPLVPRDQMPWMPKGRYAIMRRHMPRVGKLGLDMMTRTCTVQVNLDFADEADMARKMRVSLALQPLATALLANSPFVDGKPNGYLSNRARIWTDTDNTRSGMPMQFFEGDFSFDAYVDWLLDVPMYFVMRNGRMIDAAGCSFRDWMGGRPAPVLEGLEPTLGDFEDHLTTAFPDVRLKQFLEMRGADAGSPEMMLAQSALWVGLLYDDAALHAAEKLVREHPWSAYADLRAAVPTDAMNAAFPGGLRPFARRVLSIAADGLLARGLGERPYLAPLEAIADGAPTQAEHWLERYRTVWSGDVTPIFTEARV
ncbi:glutamate--cysteine ligase [Tanticharoenia sakaeratensis]|uniref:Glutamate--cysteine ligase n=1 Tax=Tanticharoenia sakaeratensis NBRC 103193 TaxID=1231623 RepID=A0A0D6MIH0_9PROT|nr:glutamate--cysteine ligase [Tanticharoenia sakaeratensis]GAN53245.1 glutamate--cysteine ligase [Tanticharoenia sakaeratensis NBRC 103193]GBQ21198.1 glutamate--cysteine ligase [Tanticharoenia sakaeratensis NBRC 103193]